MSNITSIRNTPQAAPVQPSAKPVTVDVQKTATKEASHRVDQAAISNHSLLVSKAVSVSDVRTDKVASLQKSIADGTYNVSSSDVASSIVNFLLG